MITVSHRGVDRLICLAADGSFEMPATCGQGTAQPGFPSL
jgi:hypothetical protein